MNSDLGLGKLLKGGFTVNYIAVYYRCYWSPKALKDAGERKLSLGCVTRRCVMTS